MVQRRVFSSRVTVIGPGLGATGGIGSYGFTMHAEDRDEPGSGTDRFWLETLDKEGPVVLPLSPAEPHKSGYVLIEGGDIAIPHKAQRQ